ncbi:MAG: Trm112 family protein [Desulfovibrionaceae bacterium]
MGLDKELLAILACPKCKGDLALTPQGDGLACAVDGVVYPIRDGIPVMLVEEAVPQAAWDEGARTAPNRR